MSAFIGLLALKEALGQSGEAVDTVDDGVLTSLIHRSSAIVDNYLASIRPGWVGISAGSNTRAAVGSNTRVYDGTGTETLFIDDFTTVAAISVDTVAISSNSWRLWPYNETPKRAVIYAAPATSVHGLQATHWTRGTANVGVTGYAGLPTIPDDVAQVTLAVAVLLFRRYQSGEPSPGPSTAMGGQGQVVNDPELAGILEALWPRWGVPWISGA